MSAPARGGPPHRSRFPGIPLAWAVAHSAVAFSVYYALGVVADRGLALTPAIFAVAGLVYVLATMTYAEGASMFNEAGGSNTLARHAFNELISFVAGWAILIDYVIVLALAAISVPHYLAPVSGGLAGGVGEVAVAVAVIAAAAAINIAGFTGRRRPGWLVALTGADLLLQVALIAAGLALVWDPGALTGGLELYRLPDLGDIGFALVISMVALAGIEAASDLAPDLAWRSADLRRALRAGSLVVPFVYVGMAVVALMALPVTAGPDGPQTALATVWEDAPVLGIASSLEPGWVADVARWAVTAIAPLVLLFAATVTMLGLSRHVHVLGVNRQIPSWLGRLGRRRSTPHVAILLAALIAGALVLPGDVELLAGVFAFGAMLAVSIAHLSLLRLRFTDPGRERPYAVPFAVRFRSARIPLPAVLGLLLGCAGLVTLAFLHGGALYVGGGWIAFGLLGYVAYRRLVEGISLTERVAVPERALQKVPADVELESILVPVFGRPSDDEIVSTAGRLAESAPRPGRAPPRLELLYVIDLPLSVPLEGPPPAERLERAERALARALDVASEYPPVEATAGWVTARSAGEEIVARARERRVEAIVVGGEPPSGIRGGAVLGGVRAAKPAEVGPVSAYVLRNAPCRVLLTAPPGGE